jgi:Calcium-binding EGF domain
MRASRLGHRSALTLLGLSAFGCGSVDPSDDFATQRAAVLVADGDGDGAPDDRDNCPGIANGDQARSKDFGPGDACRLSLYASSGLLGRFARFGSHKQLATSILPLRLGLGPELMKLGGSGAGFAMASYSPFTHRIGVLSQADALLIGADSLRPGETLALSVGSAPVLGTALASAVWLRLDGDATLHVVLKRAGVVVYEGARAQHGTGFARISAAAGASFDRVELSVESGSAALRGPGEVAVFELGETELDCPQGTLAENGTCRDVDECAGLNHACDPLVSCTNTEGGYLCGPCPSGFSGTGNTSCIDIDECADGSADCSPLVPCSNTTGGYACGACPSGYRGDGHSCVDVDECAETQPCDAHTPCTNREGGFDCGECPSGYRGDGLAGCVDIDECTGPTPVCDPLSACSNTPGGYDCGPCPEGYRGSGATSCVDIDECADGSATCSPLVTCANVPGAYVCGACPPGFAGDGHTCSDVDECATGSADCSALATCTNTEGSYACGACPLGYAGDGRTCTDVDECAGPVCDPLVGCSNTPGSYLCGTCPPGYTGDGYVGCLDVDECQTDNGGCADTDGCSNLSGSSTCIACPGTPGVATTCGQGLCARSGMTTCSFGVFGDSCVAGTPSVTADTSCNGLDDDCDGSVDEDFVPRTSSCGFGSCGATGTVSCVNGVEVDSCVPPSAGTACDDGNRCNGRDYCDAQGSCVTYAPSAAMCCASGVALDSLAGTGVDLTTSTDFAGAVTPLYSGPYASQLNTAPGAFVPSAVAVIRGRLLTPAGLPVSCATVNVPVVPGIGSTLTLPDGSFALVVNGGSWNVRFTAPGFAALNIALKPKENRVLELGDVRLR